MEEKFGDIFFLLDSGVSAGEFQQIKLILTRLVNQINFGASAYRLGLAQYGQDVKVEFLLNAHQTKEEIQNALKRFRQRRLTANEPRNLGSALRYARSNFFTSEAGSRADLGYQQYLVVLSGKDSDDAVDREAHITKSSGITVVGMGVGASMKEIRRVATAPYAYQSINNTVPTLKAVFETHGEKSSLHGGENAFLPLMCLTWRTPEPRPPMSNMGVSYTV